MKKQLIDLAFCFFSAKLGSVFILEVTKRDQRSKPKALRRAGLIPAVFYGRQHVSTPIAVSRRHFEKVWRLAGENTPLLIKGDFGSIDALIHQVDFDPVTEAVRHVDFYAFEKGQKVKVKVPIFYEGVSPAVKELGGTLVKVMHDIEVEAEPRDLPRGVVADISKLVDFDSQILAKDAVLPAGVALVTSAEEVLALVVPQKEEEVVTAGPVDLSAIEISEKRGKEESKEEASTGASATVTDTSPKTAGKNP